jgi:hypothetical protein
MAQDAAVTSWADFTEAAPALAATVRKRFEATGLGFLATLRSDGSPRISGIEPLFALGELWLGMMPGSRKALDLRRDPRLALHNASVDKQVTEGDVKLSGHAHEVGKGGDDEVDDEVDAAATRASFAAAFEAATGQPIPPGPFHLFRVDVTGVSSVRPDGDHLVIEWWRPGGPVQRIERR